MSQGNKLFQREEPSKKDFRKNGGGGKAKALEVREYVFEMRGGH